MMLSLQVHITLNNNILFEVPEMDSSEADCSSLGHNNFEQCNYVVVAESECKPR